MITAKEAREKAKARLNEVINEQKLELEALILEACEDGEFYVVYPRKMAEEVEMWLMDLGYNIIEEEEDELIVEWEFLEDEALNKDDEIISQEEEQAESEAKEERNLSEDFFKDEGNGGVEENFDVDGVEKPAEEAGEQKEIFFDEEPAEKNANEETKEVSENQVNASNTDDEDDDENSEDDRK